MKIVLLAPFSGLGRLRAQLAPDNLVDVATLGELESELRSGGVRAVVIDPTPLSDSGYAQLLRLLAKVGVPVVLYSHMQGFDFRRLMNSHDALKPELVFCEGDDDPVRLHLALKNSDSSVPTRLRQALIPALVELPAKMRLPTCRLFSWSTLPVNVDAYCKTCRAGSTYIRSAHLKASLVSPRRLLDIARLAQAFEDLADPKLPLLEIANGHGFGGLRSLERLLLRLIGCTPRRVRRDLDRTEFARRLEAHLNREQ